MKEKELFDVLENAEDNSMERLIEKCPEISDKQLDRILAMSERKFKMKNKEAQRNIKKTENNVVEGVERVKRPVWLTPLSTAASLILIAGIVIGSTAIIKKSGKKSGDDEITKPAVTAATETTTATVTETVTTVTVSGTTAGVTTYYDAYVTDARTAETNAQLTQSEVTEEETTESASQTETSASEVSADTELAKKFAGKWTYQELDDSVQTEPPLYNNIGTIDINEDGSYVASKIWGTFAGGIVTKGEDGFVNGRNVPTINFNIGDSDDIALSGWYNEDDLTVIYIGNGGSARIVRDTGNNSDVPVVTIAELAGEWKYQFSGDNNEQKDGGTVVIKADGTYAFDMDDGEVEAYEEGTVKIGTEEIGGAVFTTVGFYEGNNFSFGGYYNESKPDVISLGNGDVNRLVRK